MRVLNIRPLIHASLLLLIAGCAAHRQVMQDDVLRVGVCPDYPPIIYKTNDTITGVEADLATYVASNLRARVEFVEMPFDELIPRLQDRSVDIVMSGMTDADFRRDKVRFVAPYMSIGQMALVRAVDAPRFATAEHLYHVLSVGVLEGTTGERFAKTHMTNSAVSSFVEPAEAVAALKDRRIHAFVDDGPFVLQAAKDNPDLVALQWLLTDEQLAWAMPKDRECDAMYYLLNSMVKHARRTGELRKIINRYFDIKVTVK